MLMSLAYFVAMLITGTIIFFKGGTIVLWVLLAALVASYIFLVRPMLKKHVQEIRVATLETSLFCKLKEYSYEPKMGVSQQEVSESKLFNQDLTGSFLSRQLITGRLQDSSLKMADVTFPIRENGRNAFFNGVFIHLHRSGANAALLKVLAGEWDEQKVSDQQQQILKKLCSFIPGNCYMRIQGEDAYALLRGVFIDYQINPLVEVTKNTITTNPVPEVFMVQQLFLLRQANNNHSERKSNGESKLQG